MQLLASLVRRVLHSGLIRNASNSGVVRVASAGMLFLGEVLVASLVGAETYGEYGSAVVLGALLANFGDLGLQTFMLKGAAEALATERFDVLSGLLIWRRLVPAVCGSVLGLVMAGGAWLLVDPEARTGFVVAALLVPSLAMVQSNRATSLGMGQIIPPLLPELILRPLVIGGGALSMHLTGFDPSVVQLVALNLGATMAALLVSEIIVRVNTPPQVARVSPTFERRKWLGTSLPIVWTSTSYIVINRSDTLMLRALVGPEIAGAHLAASRLTNLVTLGLSSVAAIVGPQIAAAHARGDRTGTQLVLTRAAQLITLTTFALTGAMIVFGRYLLELFDPEFGIAYWPLVILCVGQLVNALTGVVGVVMSMTGLERIASRVAMVTAGVNVALNLILIPPFEMIGAAVATALTTAMLNIALAIIVKRRRGLTTVAVPARRLALLDETSV